MRSDASGSAAWQSLATLSALRLPSTAQLFSSEPLRAKAFVAEGAGITLDYSRQRLPAAALDLLVALAEQVELRARTADMFAGGIANPTEGRQVLHTALRQTGAPHSGLVADARGRMLEFAERVRVGGLTGSSGESFDLVINIGIGGSDLGPAMAVEALRSWSAQSPRVAFVSNIDGCRLKDLLAVADPRRTLFIICSKTFGTLETRTNAETARAWLVSRLGAAAVPAHFAAVSTNAAAMDAFGIPAERRFPIWDWVGGRYSIWSSVGVSLAISIGATAFGDFLAGAAAMDKHFIDAPWRNNVPVLMGLTGIWNINFLKLPTLAVLPYNDRLARLPAYLQQLEMESNGKSVRSDGTRAFCETAPVIWGEPGNNAQHSFFQLLHQGTPRAAMDFLLPAQSSCGDSHAHELAMANCLAQAEGFAFGQASDNQHKVHEGNRPVSILLFRRIDPATLGALIAAYEHKVYTQSVVWGINAFDQWGVELGKKMADEIVPFIREGKQSPSASLANTLDLLRLLDREP